MSGRDSSDILRGLCTQLRVEVWEGEHAEAAASAVDILRELARRGIIGA